MLPDVVLFNGEDSSGHTQLWETNGTAAGTFELAGVAGTFATGLYPANLQPYNADEVLFNGTDASGLSALWGTDGTAAGTHEITGILGAPTTGLGLYPSDLTNYNGEILFSGYDSHDFWGLWETNGTAAGTHELEAGPLPQGLTPSNLTVYNGYVFFTGYDSSSLLGLWKTNGTAAGTLELTGIAGAQITGTGLQPYNFTVFNGEMLFSGYDVSGRQGLWVTDGTAVGTHELTGIAGARTTGFGLQPNDLTVYNGEVLFAGYDSSGLSGLWETNGTVAGTLELTGIAGAQTTGTGLQPYNFTVFNGETLFSGYDVSGRRGLWVTDGTAVGTHELTGIAGARTTGFGLQPNDFTVYNGEVLFAGYDSSGLSGLWVTNGTAAGTYEVTGIAGAAAAGLAPADLITVGGPVLAAGASINYVAGAAPVTLGAGLSISDAESTSLIGATVSIGAGFLAGDTLSVGSPQTGIASSYNAATGVLTLSGAASLSAYRAELDSVAFASPSATHPSRTIVWSVNDGLATSASVSSSVSVAADPPVLTAGASPHYVAGSAPVALGAGLSISDAESTSLIGATVSIGAGFLAGDTLSVGSPQTGIASSYNAATGVLTLSGAASLSAYRAELDSVAFASPSATHPSRTIVWSVNDGLATSASVSSSVSVAADPPAADLSRVLWQSAAGQAAIWEMNGVNITGGGAVSPNPGPTWQMIGTGDFGGGSSDLLWQNTNGQVAIWEMNGNSVIGGGTVSANPGPAWHAVGTGDFDNNGLSDILIQNTSSGQVAVWDMNGTSIVGGGTVSSNPGPTWKAVGTGDFNDDGHSDILFQNASSGQVAIWEMNGNTIIGGGAVSANPGPSWHAIGTGDFNGDGHSDILFQNASSGQVAIWEMNGTSLIGGGAVSTNPGPSWHAIGTGGGGSDILFQNTSGQTAIWDMSGTNITGGGVVSANAGPSWKAIGLT